MCRSGMTRMPNRLSIYASTFLSMPNRRSTSPHPAPVSQTLWTVIMITKTTRCNDVSQYKCSHSFAWRPRSAYVSAHVVSCHFAVKTLCNLCYYIGRLRVRNVRMPVQCTWRHPAQTFANIFGLHDASKWSCNTYHTIYTSLFMHYLITSDVSLMSLHAIVCLTQYAPVSCTSIYCNDSGTTCAVVCNFCYSCS